MSVNSSKRKDKAFSALKGVACAMEDGTQYELVEKRGQFGGMLMSANCLLDLLRNRFPYDVIAVNLIRLAEGGRVSFGYGNYDVTISESVRNERM